MIGLKKNQTIHYRLKNGQEYIVRGGTNDTTVLLENSGTKAYKSSFNSESIVVDIGAHIGTFTISASINAPKGHVYAFEPEEQNFHLLEQNIALNHLKNVSAFQLGISDSEGTATLLVDPYNTGGHSTSFLDSAAKKQSINTITLTQFFREQQLLRIDFLKIDVEGAEYQILYTCPDSVFEKIHTIALEYHLIDRKTHNGKALKKFLETKGFQVKIRAFPGSVIGMLYAEKVNTSPRA